MNQVSSHHASETSASDWKLAFHSILIGLRIWVRLAYYGRLPFFRLEDFYGLFLRKVYFRAMFWVVKWLLLGNVFSGDFLGHFDEIRVIFGRKLFLLFLKKLKRVGVQWILTEFRGIILGKTFLARFAGFHKLNKIYIINYLNLS